MKRFLVRLMALILIPVLLLGFRVPVASAAGTSTGGLGALSDTFVPTGETFTLTSTSRFYVVSDTAPAGEFLQTVQLLQQQFAADGYALEIVWGPEGWSVTGDILICLSDSSSLGEEGYQLQVGKKAKVTAYTNEGLIYGTNMLLKHIRNGGTSIQGFHATDIPDTKQRVVSLDCGRKYYTKDWICNFIRQISWMGYNTLELHFSDDSGFRIDIWDEAYYNDNYRPANDFSWLCGSNYTSWTLEDYKNDPDKGKFLTTAEVVEILETAKEYHIDVIPAFDSPSHLDYTTWMFEQNYNDNPSYSFFSTYDNTTYYAADVNGIINYTNSSGWSTALKWPYYSAVNIKSAQGKAFIFELYIDIANFFKEYAGSTDFSIGADEVQLNTKNLASGYSYKWDFSDFVTYINELNTLLRGKGYTMRMYNDFMGSTSYSSYFDQFASNIEILYWDSPFNPSSTTASNHTQPASYYVDKGMTLYNCIQTHTYYALRITSGGSDARSVKNRQWTFYHSNEEDIYNEWRPNNVSEIGDYAESVADIPEANLGGAYFLIWCDYACVSTEREIWEGVYDKTSQNTGEFYSLLDRMWSNTIKMWNADINSSVSYDAYAALRQKFGYFPGYQDCCEAAALPAAVTPTQAFLADHSVLEAALAEGLSASDYTAESYTAYRNAYAAALAVHGDVGATESEIVQALTDLQIAQSTLVTKDAVVTVKYLTTVNGSEYLIKTETFPLTVNTYHRYIHPNTGYTYQSCDGAVFTPLASGDGSGFISGKANASVTVSLYYDNTPDTEFMQYMLRHAVQEQGSYTAASWKIYQSALNAVKNFSVTARTTQADIDQLLCELSSAQTGLVVDGESTQILTVEKLTDTARLGKQVGLIVTTTPNVSSLTVSVGTETETLTRCIGGVQTLKDGTTEKRWLVYFPADEAGTFTYTITAGSAAQSIEITVQ